jgi:hypothetical protein
MCGRVTGLGLKERTEEEVVRIAVGWENKDLASLNDKQRRKSA